MKKIMKNRTGYLSMWHDRHKRILEYAYSRFEEPYGEIDFIVAIIIKAARDHDKDFFYSADFRYFCSILRINDTTIQKIILHGIECEENKTIWNSNDEIANIDFGDNYDYLLAGSLPEVWERK